MIQDMIEKINQLDEVMIQVESEEIAYFYIQESSAGGYDCVSYDEDGEESDGGLYEAEDDSVQMGDALLRILEEKTDGEYRVIKVLSEEETEELFEDFMEMH